eukprot:scaffold89639_cov48-Attheya_sp.AAC.1
MIRMRMRMRMRIINNFLHNKRGRRGHCAMVPHIHGLCFYPCCACSSWEPLVGVPVVVSDNAYTRHVWSLIYWIETYNVEEGIYVVPNLSLVDQYVCTSMCLKEVEMPEAETRALGQLILYILGFDPPARASGILLLFFALFVHPWFHYTEEQQIFIIALALPSLPQKQRKVSSDLSQVLCSWPA